MKKIAFWALMCLVFVACQKDDDTNPILPNQDDPVVEIIVKASIEGVILDESGDPIVQAKISLGQSTTLSNNGGLFVLNNVEMNQLGAFLKVEKEGFFTGSTRFFPKEGTKNFTRITLLNQDIIGNFEASSGGLIDSPEGIKLDFPAAAIINPDNNQTYTGNVSVAARWLNPEAENIQEIMPGSLQGVNEAGEEVTLLSYGMMAVELLDNSGNLLQLGNGQKATLSFPIPEAYRNQAPNEIPLWYFNESIGLWQEEGKAILQGDYYVGEVSHFSFWNCDEPYDLVQLEGKMIFKSDQGTTIPLANVRVKISTQGLGCRYAYTDEEGYFSGKVPANVSLVT